MRLGQIFSAAALLLLAAGSLCAKEVIKVGVVTPMSGDFAVLKELADVMQVAVDRANKDEANRYEYHLIFEDSQFDPKKSYLAAQKLISVDKVDVILSVAALSAKVIDPLAKAKQVPQLAIASENEVELPWTFTYFTTAEDTAMLALRTAQKLGAESFLMVGQRQEAILLMSRALSAAAVEPGMQDRGVILWNGGDTKDFRAHILKAKEKSPDFIAFMPTPPDPDIFFRQMRELGVEIPVVGLESYQMVSDPSVVEGKWLSGCPPISDEFTREMADAGVDVTLGYTPYAYDLPAIAIEAVESAAVDEGASKPTGLQIRNALRELKTIQTTQGEVRLDDKGAFHPMPVLVYYEDGVGRQVSVEELIEIKEGKL